MHPYGIPTPLWTRYVAPSSAHVDNYLVMVVLVVLIGCGGVGVVPVDT